MQWHHARGFNVSKHNGKAGVDGERIVVVLCPLGRLFYQLVLDGPADEAAKISQAWPPGSDLVPDPTALPEWAFGCVKKKRREEAIVIQKVVSWQYEKEQYSVDTKLFSILAQHLHKTCTVHNTFPTDDGN